MIRSGEGFWRDSLVVGAANLMSLAVSAAAVLVLPALLTVADYGYVQLYLLLTSFAGILHFGWADGVYLSLGGRPARILDGVLLRSDYRFFMLFQVALASGFASLAWSTIISPSARLTVCVCAAASIFFANSRVYRYMALQAVGLSRRYASAVIVDRMVFVLVAALLIAGTTLGYVGVLVADIGGRIVSLLVTQRRRRVVGMRAPRVKLRWIGPYFIGIGFPLLLANAVGQLILGLPRLVTDASLGIETFAALSLALSLAALGASFATALSIPLFPRLRRLDAAELTRLYRRWRPRLGAGLLALTLVYPLVSVVIPQWFPKYVGLAEIVSLLFPVLLYQSQLAILYATLLKTLRLQWSFLVGNLIALLLGGALAWYSAAFLGDIRFVAGAMLLASWVQARIAERLVARALDVRVWEGWLEDFSAALFLVAHVVWPGDARSAIWTMITAVVVLALFSRERWARDR